ncbi:hypothetical protein Kisp02_72470 [Kineosporia sp. NBRC 101731]|nr:hypothetical protein Kisp02_72470 [Kineosporia sp. NBRC 101731]
MIAVRTCGNVPAEIVNPSGGGTSAPEPPPSPPASSPFADRQFGRQQSLFAVGTRVRRLRTQHVITDRKRLKVLAQRLDHAGGLLPQNGGRSGLGMSFIQPARIFQPSG